MNIKELGKETLVIILAAIVLALAVAYKENAIIYAAFGSFLIIILANVIVKKAIGYFFEIDVKTKFWSWYQYGLRKDSHFKQPVPMAWLPLLLSLFTKGFFWWLGILEFDVDAKAERVSRKHGLYRFTEVTDWHIAWIAIWGIIANVILAIGGYVLGFELFAKLSLYYAAWSIIPIGKLDGTKIFFASRPLWISIFIGLLIVLSWGLIVI